MGNTIRKVTEDLNNQNSIDSLILLFFLLFVFP